MLHFIKNILLGKIASLLLIFSLSAAGAEDDYNYDDPFGDHEEISCDNVLSVLQDHNDTIHLVLQAYADSVSDLNKILQQNMDSAQREKTAEEIQSVFFHIQEQAIDLPLRGSSILNTLRDCM